jgi:pimeloyl-ACP methyl ester carboxylesterase
VPFACGIYYSVHEGVGKDSLPVLLVHGAGGTYLYWPPEIRRLPGYRVFAIDLPGHGKSGATEGRQSIGDYARSIRDWMIAVGMPRAVLVGHSMGGAIVLAMAIHYPEHVLGIGLVGSGARMPVNSTLLQNAARTTTFYQATEAIISWSFGSQAPPRLVELASKRMAEIRPSVLHGDLLACSTFDATAHLGEINCPTLVVCGGEDKMMPSRYSQFMANMISQARLESIPGAGHMVMLEQPERVATALASFLGRIPHHAREAI